MEKKDTIYPDWVRQHRTVGTVIKKRGDKFYLYKRTSRYVPGKKYPQAVDIYLGTITKENGVVYAEKKMIPTSGCIVKEYGFSKVMRVICPAVWKQVNGEDWEEYLKMIIHKSSPNSYLAFEGKVRSYQDIVYDFSGQTSSLYRKIYKEYGVGKDELEQLKYIYVIYSGKKKLLSEINDEQKKILEQLGIQELEVE